MTGRSVESLEERKSRYSNAVYEREKWSQEFDQVYRFMLPNRLPLAEDSVSTFNAGYVNKGADRTKEIWDPTGTESVITFANNMQSTLMPDFQRWAEIDISDNIEDLPPSYTDKYGKIDKKTVDSIRYQLDKINEILFEQFQKSNLSQVINESFTDLAVGTGVIMINAGDIDNPLEFYSVPANNVLIEGGTNDCLKNIWRPLSVRARNIKNLWPKASIPKSLEGIIKRTPDEIVRLVDGTLYYPTNDKGYQYYYFVMDEEGKNEIYSEWLDMDKWIAFRGYKSPGEVYGRGPALTALPYVRQLNVIMEMVTKGLKFSLVPAFLARDTSEINPWTLSIEAGSIITVGDNGPLHEQISRLDLGVSPEYPMKIIDMMQMTVKEIMFTNPIGPHTTPNESATKVKILANEWIRKNQGFFNRLSTELFPQLINKSVHVLQKMGSLPKLKVNGIECPLDTNNLMLKLKFTTPMAKIQDEDDIQAIEQGIMFLQNMFGPQNITEALLSLNVEKVPETVFRKLGIDNELVNPDFATSPLIKSLKNVLNINPAAQGQQGPQSAAAPGNPTPVDVQNSLIK